MTGCCLLLDDADGNKDINSKLLTRVAAQGPVGIEYNLPSNYIQISSLRRRPQRHSGTIFNPPPPPQYISVRLLWLYFLHVLSLWCPHSWPHLSSLHPKTSSSSWPPLALHQFGPVSKPHQYHWPNPYNHLHYGSHSDSQSCCCVLSLYQSNSLGLFFTVPPPSVLLCPLLSFSGWERRANPCSRWSNLMSHQHFLTFSFLKCNLFHVCSQFSPRTKRWRDCE